MRKILMMFFVILMQSMALLAQEENQTTNPHRQFDFWVGKWNVYTGDDLVARNTIELKQNRNVLQENWVSVKENFTGTSFSFYNPKTKKWHQVWVDRNGSNTKLIA